VQQGIDSAAIEAASIGRCEVWVAAGRYYIGAAASADRKVLMKSGVDLYGGFNGNEMSSEERDWEANETILDGRHELGNLGYQCAPEFRPERS
jgi:hypothetical protein